MKYKTVPYKHQIEALKRASSSKIFALLMEQGTGKSKVIIDGIAADYPAIKAVLIIAPNGVNANWIRNEIPTHLDDSIPRLAVVWKSSGHSIKYKRLLLKLLQPFDGVKILAMNVEAFSAKRPPEFAEKFLRSVSPSQAMIVVDESTRIKSHQAKRTKAVLKLKTLADTRRILTGTPITQSPLDVFTQFSFLDPKIIGFNSYYAFKCHFAQIVQRIAIDGAGRSYKYEEVVGYKNLDELHNKISKFSFRVLKSDCLDLPDKIYTRLIVPMADEQRRIYEKLRDDFVLEAQKDAEIPVPLVLTRLLRMQQVTGGYVPDDAGGGRELEDNPKLNVLISDISDLPENESVIVWARFRNEIESIAARLRVFSGGKKNAVGVYYGSTNVAERAEIIDRFQRGETRFFVGNQQTAGLGLTLTAATTVYYYSNDFSLESRTQSEDRCHRIGQKKHVVYKDIVCENTIDEYVLNALKSKRDVADAVLKDGAVAAVRKNTVDIAGAM